MFGVARTLKLSQNLSRRCQLTVRRALLSFTRPTTVSFISHRTLTSTTFANAEIVSTRPSIRSKSFDSKKSIEVDETDVTEAKEEDGRATFSSIKESLNKHIYRAITQKPFQYETMSEVQEAVLALLPRLSSSPSPTPLNDEANAKEQAQDLLVRAKTGTGKTLAFLIPALEGRVRDLESFERRWKEENTDKSKHEKDRALAKYARSTVGALILSPTRELATQIATEAQALTSHLPDFGVRLFVGGASKGIQYREWARSKSNDIVVATPGRCLDFLESEAGFREPLSRARMLILDEADTLLDMGFADAISTISSYLPEVSDRQTFLFSATVSKQIREIARKSMKKDHAFIDTVKADDVDTHLHIPQYYTVLPTAEDQLMHIFRLLAHDQLLHARKAARNNGQDGGKAVIFLPTTRLTQMFSLVLSAMKAHLPWGRDTHIVEIHSKKDQNQRTRASDSFRKNKSGYSILVTSDVSARGVDYPGVTRVIQVGIPGSRDLYIHRVGRTGRAGKEGRGDIVLLPWERNFVQSTLGDIPMKPYSVEDGETDLVESIKAWDENPEEVASASSASRERRSSRISSPRTIEMRTPVQPRLDSLEESLKTSVLPSLDEEAIRETFASLLGYYVNKSTELRTRKEDILAGLKEWATGSMGLEQEPHVSSMFLQKIGMSSRGGRSDRDSRNGGFSRGPRDRGGRNDSFIGRKFTNDRRESSSPRERSSYGSSRGSSNRFESSGDRFADRGPPKRRDWGGEDESRGFSGSRRSQDQSNDAPRRSYGERDSKPARSSSFERRGASNKFKSPYDASEADSWERTTRRVSRY